MWRNKLAKPPNASAFPKQTWLPFGSDTAPGRSCWRQGQTRILVGWDGPGSPSGHRETVREGQAPLLPWLVAAVPCCRALAKQPCGCISAPLPLGGSCQAPAPASSEAPGKVPLVCSFLLASCSPLRAHCPENPEDIDCISVLLEALLLRSRVGELSPLPSPQLCGASGRGSVCRRGKAA